MGATISQCDSVDLKTKLSADVYEAIVSQTYTVQRTPKNKTESSREEEGWQFLREPEPGISWAATHAAFVKDQEDKLGWRLFMVNGFKPTDPEFLYGWRLLGTFWPTHLKTQEEREAWSAWLLNHIETPLQKQADLNNT